MKLGYLCKYVPVEMLESMGADVELITPEVTGFETCERLMHPNMCSFIKAVLEDYQAGDYDGIVLTNCCDSTRRLHDCIKEEFPDRFVYMLDLPRLVNETSVDLYTSSVKKLAEKYSEASGSGLDEDALRSRLKAQYDAPAEEKAPAGAPLNIAVMGARFGRGVREMLDEYNVNIVDDMTCTETDRRYDVQEKDVLHGYSRALMEQFPCMRMADVQDRLAELHSDEKRVDGIIYHTMKFCDMYSYEFAFINRHEEIPVLKIETDSTSQSAGQLRTRIEAFLESLAQAKGLPAEDVRKPERDAEKSGNEGTEGDGEMFGRKKKAAAAPESAEKTVKKKGGRAEDLRIIGIDSGSTSTNAVVMDGNRNLIASLVIRTGARSSDSAREAYEKVLAKAGLGEDGADMVVSTGYGRINIEFADREITEISCHGRGANYFNPKTRTILDIGGQDSKAIRIDDKGNVLDFAMNDKCAAGTGRFLEMMAATLGVSMDELGPLSEKWHEDIDISSMCSVFAESEVISLIADNKEKADIAHGIHKSIASRAVSLMKRVGMEADLMMTGGVAKNEGAVKEIEKKAGHSLYICDSPEIVGAVGAALFGIDELTA